ncbi:MAG: hypothetical protein R3F61_08105 [Myxococcota bacterium]
MSKKKSDTPPKGPKAADLLPPDGPAPVDPKTVVRADDALEPEVEDRKIGIRRVSSLEFGNKLWQRANRRAAGNSRSFWRNIEADDPFLQAPARPTDAPLEIYPAQRIERTSGSQPKPQPDVARAYPPPSRQDDVQPNRPTPRKEAPRTKAPAPEARHTPEPRPAPPPPPRRAPEPEPVPERVPEPVSQSPSEPPGRRLPPKPQGGASGGGRIRTGRQRMPSAASGEEDGRPMSAAEIRAEKQRLRDIAMDKEKPFQSGHTLDKYRDFVQLMEIQQAAHERGEEIPTAFADQVDEPVRRPKPQAEAKRPKAEPEPEPAPAPRAPPVAKEPPPAPPIDRSPPKPKPPEKPEPPKAPAGKPANLDDLFGGGQQEGRVRIGKRATPKATPEGE